MVEKRGDQRGPGRPADRRDRRHRLPRHGRRRAPAADRARLRGRDPRPPRAPEAPLSETPFSTDVSWRAEVEAARRARADFDAESRRPAHLARFSRAARHELGAAGTPLLATKAERRREQWVVDRMVEAGRA